MPFAGVHNGLLTHLRTKQVIHNCQHEAAIQILLLFAEQ